MSNGMNAAPFQITMLTLFPDIFPGPLGCSVLGKARDKGLWDMALINIRDYADNKHHNVDDTPFGGGAGMVMRADVIDRALTACASRKGILIAPSPKGKVMDQALAKQFAAGDGLKILCGRYEGIDQRVLDHWDILEVSLGDFVLTGGEIPALAMADAVLRLRAGVIGKPESLIEESFEDGLLEYPHYTRPVTWQGRAVPEILQTGHHQNIAAWRRAQAEAITKRNRPDLWTKYQDQLQQA